MKPIEDRSRLIGKCAYYVLALIVVPHVEIVLQRKI